MLTKEDVQANLSFDSTFEIPDGCEGLSFKLVEKIRARETAAVQARTIAPEARRASLRQTLPALALSVRSTLHTTSASAKRPQSAMAEVALLETLRYSRGAASTDELKEQLELLAEAAPAWCDAVYVGDRRVFRIRNDIDFNDVLRQLKAST
eukprot:1509493-Pleurochrysis_carterae.AAC.2